MFKGTTLVPFLHFNWSWNFCCLIVVILQLHHKINEQPVIKPGDLIFINLSSFYFCLLSITWNFDYAKSRYVKISDVFPLCAENGLVTVNGWILICVMSLATSIQNGISTSRVFQKLTFTAPAIFDNNWSLNNRSRDLILCQLINQYILSNIQIDLLNTLIRTVTNFKEKLVDLPDNLIIHAKQLRKNSNGTIIIWCVLFHKRLELSLWCLHSLLS